MKVLCVVGARPNFMKMAPIIAGLNSLGIHNILIHTGQHYDDNMSEVFFVELGIPKPNIYLKVGSGTHGKQTGRIMIAFEKICFDHSPDLVIVAGDVNSTIACSLVASKLNIPVAHIEAGLRSFDRKMPEEINRVLTDHLSDLLFTTEESGEINLINEGIDKKKIHFVGNCMIDTLLKFKKQALLSKAWDKYGLKKKSYVLVTLHRPSNVDTKKSLVSFFQLFNEIAITHPVIFPAHPRTKSLIEAGVLTINTNIQVIDPLPYFEFIGLMAQAECVVTDSGGIQEETTALKIPCITVRENTERPITVEIGSNILAGTNRNNIMSVFNKIVKSNNKNYKIPPLWDGNAGIRTSQVIDEYLNY